MQAIFGGTFDPFHLGHAHVISKLLEAYKFEKLWVIPCGQNPLKLGETRTTALQRLELTRLGILELGLPGVEVLDWEAKQSGPSFTVETLQKFYRELRPKEAPALILGTDAFAHFETWKSPTEILKLTHLVVVKRPGLFATEEKLRSLGIQDIEVENPHRIWHSGHSRFVDQIEIHALPFSATQIRQEIRIHKEMPQGIQRSVWLYAKENSLYAV